MTIQWTVIAAFLYLELVFIALLLLPFVSSKIWQHFFYSRFFKFVSSKADIYFSIFIVVLILFFLDSVREMRNYSNMPSKDLAQQLQINLKLFRSQRNYYISGFTVFLWIVIRRLILLLLSEANLLSENETAMKRAQNATETVEKILKTAKEVAKDKENCVNDEKYVEEVKNLKQAINNTKSEIEHTLKIIEHTKQKSVEVSKEYSCLSEKYAELLEKVEDLNDSL